MARTRNAGKYNLRGTSPVTEDGRMSCFSRSIGQAWTSYLNADCIMCEEQLARLGTHVYSVRSRWVYKLRNERAVLSGH